jgi:glycerophosphoryl diester phosphodiesterase
LALPLLGEVLKRYSTAAFLDIELKVCGLEAITMELLCAHPPARGCVISSFLPEVLQTLHGMDASVPLGLICETRDQFASWPRLPIEYVIPHHNLVTQSVVTESKTKGKKILVWTVNSAKNMRRFAEWEVDGVISDDPEKLVRTLGRKSETNRNK